MKKKYKLLISILIFLQLCIVIVLIGYSIIVKNPIEYVRSYHPHHGGFAMKDRALVNKKEVYNVTYNLTADEFRISSHECKDCSKHIVLAGDSFVFGQGLKDDETVSYILERMLSNTRVFNWGKRGFSVGDFVESLLKLPFHDIKEEEEGNFIYILQDFHFHRLLFGSNHLDFMANNANAYKMKNDHSYARLGMFASYMVRVEYYVYQIIFRFKKKMDAKFNYNSQSLTNEQMDTAVKLSSLMLIELRDKYLLLHKNGKFKVVLVDFETYDRHFISKAEETFRKINIDFKTFRPLSVLGKTYTQFDLGDGHPKVEYNFALSKFIKEYL
jgi:hypothetical protein